MKRWISYILLLGLFCSVFCFRTAEAAPAVLTLSADACILADADSGQVLYEKNMNQRIYPASLVKVLTCLLALENCDPDETVIVPESALDIEPDSSAIYVEPGEVLTMRDCLYTLIMASANDIANTIAEHVSGSVSAFVDLMNRRAAELGAQNTHFTNPHGLHRSDNYTTLSDLLLIATAAWKRPEFREILLTAQYSIPPTNYCSETRYYNQTHEMRRYLGPYYYSPCLGGKTGYTPESGYSLLSYAQKEEDGIPLLTLVAGCSVYGQQYEDSETLFEYGFDSFKKASQPLKGTYLGQIPVYLDTAMEKKLGYVKVCASSDLVYDISISASDTPSFDIEADFPTGLVYPVSDGDAAGYLRYRLNGKLIASIPCEITETGNLTALAETGESQPSAPASPTYLLSPTLTYCLAAAAFLLFAGFLAALRYLLLHRSRR